MEAILWRPALPAGVHVERRGSDILLLHPQAPRWAAVNPAGLEVARLCDGQHSVEQIAEQIGRRWGQDAASVVADVCACVDGLRRAGFLDPDPAGRPGPAATGGGWRLHLYLTDRCNLRCRHCAVAGSVGAADRLSSPALRALIDQAVATGAEGIAFSGGEPLLRPDWLDLVGHSARQVKTLLATNATLLDDRTAAALAAMGVVVQVSLDGATAAVHDAIRGAGAFERAWRGIDLLLRHGLGERLALNVTLTRLNLAQVQEIVSLAAERGVRGVRFAPVQRLGRAAEGWADLAPGPEEAAAAYRALFGRLAGNGTAVSPGLPGLELEPPDGRPWCQLGRVLLVDASGDLYPCTMLAHPQFRLGNVAEMSLAAALTSDRLERLAAQCARRVDEIEVCRACPWRLFCQAGCPASVWALHGTWHAIDGLCDLRRELYRELVLARAGRRPAASQVPSGCDGIWRLPATVPDL